MTLWHIDDFDDLAKAVPSPWPWDVVGVLPTADDYMRLGSTAWDPDHAFCYTVSTGPTEVWCPLTSVEGRFCPPELITAVINVIFTAVDANRLIDGDNMIVPFDYATDDGEKLERRDSVFWIGATVEDPDRSQFHCYASPHTTILPVRWSSPEGWDDDDE